MSARRRFERAAVKAKRSRERVERAAIGRRVERETRARIERQAALRIDAMLPHATLQSETQHTRWLRLETGQIVELKPFATVRVHAPIIEILESKP